MSFFQEALQVATEVEIHGLTSARGKKLNGLQGKIITARNDKGRWGVEINYTDEQVSLKSKNLRVLTPINKNKTKKRKTKILDPRQPVSIERIKKETKENLPIIQPSGHYGQVVIGPPGSGKTTYCNLMAAFLRKFGREVAIINLDPANENMPYVPDIDIFELVNLSEIMEHLKLGPNGGLMYCLEYLNKNKDWLREKIKGLKKDTYLIFDLPGQAELMIHHNATRELMQTMVKDWNYKLTCVNLIECRFCTEVYDFISSVLLTLSSMLHLELPHVNVFSKVDLWENFKDGAALPLDYYSDIPSLGRLLEKVPKNKYNKKFRKLNESIADLLTDYNLVNYFPFNVNDFDTVMPIIEAIDKGNGFFYSGKFESFPRG